MKAPELSGNGCTRLPGKHFPGARGVEKQGMSAIKITQAGDRQ